MKLGYNELVNNKYTCWSQMTKLLIKSTLLLRIPVITNKFGRSRAVRYNRVFFHNTLNCIMKKNHFDKNLIFFIQYFFPVRTYRHLWRLQLYRTSSMLTVVRNYFKMQQQYFYKEKYLLSKIFFLSKYRLPSRS